MARTDYAMLNTFLPHPEYSKQRFVCILNPSDETTEIVKQVIIEAHSLATSRLSRPANLPYATSCYVP